MQAINGDFVNAQGQQVDFDGNVNVSWTPVGGETGFEIEKLTPDNPDWQFVADVGAGATSYAFNNLPNGQYSFRVRGIQPGQVGSYVTVPGNAAGIVVNQRSLVDITSQVSWPFSTTSFNNTTKVYEYDIYLVNNSTQTYVPLVDLNVVSITSGTGTVKAINADNGKDGKSLANAARFSYSQSLGSDEMFSPSEATSTRALRFQDNAGEMFTFDAVATAYVSSGGTSSSSSSASAPTSPSGGGGSGSLLPLTKVTAVMRFTANPLTKTATAQLIKLQ
jgi:hypothetical protein